MDRVLRVLTGKFVARFAACCTCFVLLENPALAQQPYPNKPLRLVVAFGPGGIADTIGRLVGQKLNDRDYIQLRLPIERLSD